MATRLMGFGFDYLKMYTSFLESDKWNILNKSELNLINIRSNNPRYIVALGNNTEEYLNFKPHIGWRCMQRKTPAK